MDRCGGIYPTVSDCHSLVAMSTLPALATSTAPFDSLAATPLALADLFLSMLLLVVVVGAFALAAVWMLWGRRD